MELLKRMVLKNNDQIDNIYVYATSTISAITLWRGREAISIFPARIRVFVDDEVFNIEEMMELVRRGKEVRNELI